MVTTDDYVLPDWMFGNCPCCLNPKVHTRTVTWTCAPRELTGGAVPPVELLDSPYDWDLRSWTSWTATRTINNVSTWRGIERIDDDPPPNYHYQLNPDDTYDGTVDTTYVAAATGAPYVFTLDGKHDARALVIADQVCDGTETRTKSMNATRTVTAGPDYTGTVEDDYAVSGSVESTNTASRAYLPSDVTRRIEVWSYSVHDKSIEVKAGTGPSQAASVETVAGGWIVHMATNADSATISTVDDVILLIRSGTSMKARRASGCDGLDVMTPCAAVDVTGGSNHTITLNTAVMPSSWDGVTLGNVQIWGSIGTGTSGSTTTDTPESEYTVTETFLKDVNQTLTSNPGSPPWPEVQYIDCDHEDVRAQTYDVEVSKAGQQALVAATVEAYDWNVADSDLVAESGPSAGMFSWLSVATLYKEDGTVDADGWSYTKTGIFVEVGSAGVGGAWVTGYTAWTPDATGITEDSVEFAQLVPVVAYRGKAYAGPVQFDPPAWADGQMEACVTAVYMQPDG